MSVLLKEIKAAYPAAASTLEWAELRTDSDIQSLTRDDLHELFPGSDKIKMRKSIFDIIHKQKPINILLKELKDFIPQESFRAALTNNGVLVDYLNILKSLKGQVDNVQHFLNAHIGLLEDISKTHPDQEPGRGFSASTSTSAPHGAVEPHNDQKHGSAQEAYGAASGSSKSTASSWVDTKGKSEGLPQGAHGKHSMESPRQYKEVMYQMVVSGQTFDAHLQLMENIKAQVKNEAQLTECSQNSNVVILFCPISSRIGTDIISAMNNLPVSIGNKPVILVLMHYTREVKVVPSQRTWPEHRNVVFHVNIFYHETVPGLLTCQENTDAVSDIQKKLLQYSVTQYYSDNEWSVIPERSRTDSVISGKGKGSSNPGESSKKSTGSRFWLPSLPSFH